MLVLLFKLIPNTLCTNINAPTIYNDFSFHYNLIFLLSCFSLLIEYCNHRLHLSLSLSLSNQIINYQQAYKHSNMLIITGYVPAHQPVDHDCPAQLFPAKLSSGSNFRHVSPRHPRPSAPVRKVGLNTW